MEADALEVIPLVPVGLVADANLASASIGGDQSNNDPEPGDEQPNPPPDNDGEIVVTGHRHDPWDDLAW